jgi:indolepyruvate ferredoxin oxidoreductase, beta subunit
VTDPGLLTLLIPAVGGQGGGVLSEWVIEAAQAAGHVACGTSIPGVAQRTGSTSYYVEVFTGGDGETPTFSLYPVPGALDVLLAPELLEIGRMIELGFPSPSRTTIVTSTHRLYSIHEKITTAGSVYPSDRLLAAAGAFSKRLLALDALALAREHLTEANAILLGALAGSGALPIPIEAYRSAIERKGIQVATNVAGFEIGLQHGRGVEAEETRGRSRPEGSEHARRDPAHDIGDTTGDVDRETAELVAGLPERVRSIAAQAIARLVDYQDHAYARRYLDRLRPFIGESADPDTAGIVARLLAVWMTYEDAVRVADLKTRLARFERIRRETRAGDAEIVVTDFLKPELDEIYGILPARLVGPFARWAERRWPHGRPTPGQHVKTTTVSGYLRLWLLARLRRLRPVSYRARHEHERMERWLALVSRGAAIDPDLGRELARAARLVKGYGEVRRRLLAAFDDLLARVLGVIELERARGHNAAVSTALARRYRELALTGPEGETEATSWARAVVDRVAAGDRDAALSLVERR